MTQKSFDTNPVSTSVAQGAYLASLTLATTKGADRNRGVQAIAQVLRRCQNDILEANTLDLEGSREMAVPDLILEWLKLTPERLNTAIQLLERLSELPDPLRQVMQARHQVVHCQTYCQLIPLGVIALIYEAFPELGAIAAGFCLKTGNSLILRGGTEASHSNVIIAQVLQTAAQEAGLPLGCIQVLSTDAGGALRDLVTQDQFINLVIPYGRPSLVQQVLKQSTAPVLKSAMGNCYVYWSPSGSLEAVRLVILDSHQSQPDPVNAIEKVLISAQQSRSSLVMLWNSLREKGFEVRGDRDLTAEFPELNLTQDSEWDQPYLNRIVAFKSVEGLDAAIAWINQHSSGHADCLITDSYQESQQFALGVNSASTYINASPRFYRVPKHGDTVFLGMSNQKGQRRGVIGLESLTTLKHVIQGSGLP
jgi:glutamate-5-semialdehyde dehydrogenase